MIVSYILHDKKHGTLKFPVKNTINTENGKNTIGLIKLF